VPAGGKKLTEADYYNGLVPDGGSRPASTDNSTLQNTRDTLEGYGAQYYDWIFGEPLTKWTGKNWMTDRGPVYGNEEAFQNGRAIARGTLFVMDAVITASGVGGAINGTVTAIRSVQATRGAIQVAQLLTDAGGTVNVVMVNGKAVEATTKVLVSLGVSAEAAASLMATGNNAGQGGSPPNPGGNTPTGLGGPSIEDLSKAASAPDRAGFTAAGRSLTKHGSGARPGNSLFPAAKGNPAQINAQAQAIVDDILNNPGTTFAKGFRGRFGDTIEAAAPDGRGIVFDANGKFLFFKE
jgi:hypothetical protein